MWKNINVNIQNVKVDTFGVMNENIIAPHKE